MAQNKINLKVVTPTRKFFEDKIDMVILRTTIGDIGVMPGHQPLTTTVGYGVMRIQNNDAQKIAVLLGGFCEITPEEITILTDGAEWADEIDLARAQAAKQRAEERLNSANKEKVDSARAEAALKRAIARIETKNF